MLELPAAAMRAGRTRTQLERRGIRFETDAYIVDEHLIWGATARILETCCSSASPTAPLRADLHGHAHEVAPLRPRAVVVLDALAAEQLVQHEPRVRRALADAAVRDDLLAVQHALAPPYSSRQFLRRLERAVVAARPAPTGSRPRPGCARARCAPSCS